QDTEWMYCSAVLTDVACVGGVAAPGGTGACVGWGAGADGMPDEGIVAERGAGGDGSFSRVGGRSPGKRSAPGTGDGGFRMCAAVPGTLRLPGLRVTGYGLRVT